MKKSKSKISNFPPFQAGSGKIEKKGINLILIIASFILIISNPISALYDPCELNISLINQDPYPAIPGDYVEVVFQMSGVENANCEGAKLKLIEDYPFSLDKDVSSFREIFGETYVQNYKNTWMIPYKLRVDENAMEGVSKIDVKYSPGRTKDLIFSEKFNIKIEDVRVDFEVSIKEYNPNTNEITFEILNTGENNVEALTIEVFEQDNLNIKSSPRKVIGSLDSNEETTFDLNAVPSEGNLDLKIIYTDEINERRSLDKKVYFNPNYFETEKNTKGLSFWFYVSIILIVYLIFRIYRNKKKKKK